MRGTILLVGHHDRVIELLTQRLEKEHYSVILTPPQSSVFGQIKAIDPQAVLCSVSLGHRFIEKIARYTRHNKRTRLAPVLLVGESDAPLSLTQIFGVGEVLRLHHIPLAEAIRRLNLAIQLMHLVSH